MKLESLRAKVWISLILAMLFSILFLPLGLQEWEPPIVAMVLFYWLIFQDTSIDVWGIWLVGLFSGCLLGDPLGISSFLVVLLAWPLLHHRHKIRFSALSSCWFVWLLASSLFILLKLALMAMFGYISFSLFALKSVAGIILLSPLLYFFLNSYAQFALMRKRLS